MTSYCNIEPVNIHLNCSHLDDNMALCDGISSFSMIKTTSQNSLAQKMFLRSVISVDSSIKIGIPLFFV